MTIFGHNCDICECTCDQFKHKDSERFLYAGKIEAEPGLWVEKKLKFCLPKKILKN